MRDGLYFGFDFGEKRIGMATGQSITGTANALTILPANKGEPDWDKLDSLIAEWRPIAAVVGIPYDMNDQITAITKKAMDFCENLRKRYNWTVYEVDERLTSFDAREELKKSNQAFKKADVDKYSAKLILETFLTERGRNG